MQKPPPTNATQSNTLGERWADKMAEFGGSWTFIILFLIIMTVWVAFNSWLLLFKPFDPYPFIFLNFVLTCIAAIQAPVIMMSQNRQEAKDRIRAEQDYQINLRAEREIQHLTACLKKLSDLQIEHFNKLEETISQLKKP